MTPLWPVVHALFSDTFTTNAKIGKAMIRVAKDGCDKDMLDTPDINRLAGIEREQIFAIGHAIAIIIGIAIVTGAIAARIQ